MPATKPPTPLKTFLICYGAEDEFWLCEAGDRDHAVEQFEAAATDCDINEVFQWALLHNSGYGPRVACLAAYLGEHEQA